MTPLERAIQEQIAFLTDELRRVRVERETAERLKHARERPIDWALTDPGFRDFLLRKQFDAHRRAHEGG